MGNEGVVSRPSRVDTQATGVGVMHAYTRVGVVHACTLRGARCARRGCGLGPTRGLPGVGNSTHEPTDGKASLSQSV